MKVLLRSDVQGVGRRGDIVEVKSGYARNFLVPSGQALVASETMEAQAAWMRKSRDVKDAQSREAAETQRGVIEQARLTIAARAGTNGRLFGSVTEADVVNALRSATNISLDRHAIHMDEHLKEIGTATVQATLFDGVVATINVEVVAK
ncbi:MAG TPA: 50S ribosomal protein L9 [Acidimicrobiales bacterium]|nr:50S ribosomal protein L9 [Acidimicrobiales bacterium]